MIATSGTSGGVPPHLHFDINDEKEKQLNDIEIENAKQKYKDNPKAMSILNGLL